MNINKHNYEAFFLDYHEGNLSPQQVADLLLFIEQHPEFREEFESFENVILDDLSAITFDNKSDLKKKITSDNREEYFIRSVENTLTPTEKLLLSDFIKQHPQYSAEFELFQKTKIQIDESIVYENKDALKRTAVAADDLLIAAMEGLLTKQETALLNQQLSVDAEMQYHLSVYEQTKLVPDSTVVYENKEELKRKEKRIIPFFYYVSGVAAAIILLIGLFFLFSNNEKSDPQFANEITPEQKKENAPNLKNETLPEVQANNVVNTTTLAASAINNVHKKEQTNPSSKKEPLQSPVINNEQQENAVVDNKTPVNELLPISNNEQPIVNIIHKSENNNEPANTIAGNQNKNTPTEEYLSLRQLAASAIKEKTLDNNSVAVQKENGRIKRFSGWDVAQIVTRGISKLTGRDVEVKPKYNEEGDVTAYALGNSFQIARGK